MKRRGKYRAVIFLAVALALPAPVFAGHAAQEKKLGSFGAWHAYTYNEGGQTVCYMVTTKTIKSTGPRKRSQPYVMITHRPIEASTDVISYGAGAILNARRGVKIRVAQNTFDLFAVRDTAWARDALTDHKLAAAFRQTARAQFLGTPAQKGGKPIRDTFDLTGASDAYHAIGKACGLPETPTKSKIVRKSAKPGSRKN